MSKFKTGDEVILTRPNFVIKGEITVVGDRSSLVPLGEYMFVYSTGKQRIALVVPECELLFADSFWGEIYEI